MSVMHVEGPEKTARVMGRVTAGIDWSSTEHAVAIVDADGVQRDRFVITHTVPGLRQLVRRLRQAGGAGGLLGVGRVLVLDVDQRDGPAATCALSG